MSPASLLQHFEQISEASDAVSRLRRFILDLAVRGKLVEQDTADEPASEFLKRIDASQAILTKDKKSVSHKQQPFEIDDACPFPLPKSWEWTRLGSIAEKLTDGSHNPPRNAGSGYPMLSSQNVQDGSINFENPSRYLTESDFHAENRRTQIDPGDVLLTIVATIGRSAVVPSSAPQFALQRSVAVIRTQLNAEFFSLQLRSPYAFTYYDEHAKGTAQRGIYLKKLAAFPVAVPPLVEQHRIVAKVDELMKLCDELEAVQTKRERRRDRLVTATLHGLNNGEANDENGETLSFEESARFYYNHLPRLTIRPEHIQQLRQTILNLAVRGKLVRQDPKHEPAADLLNRTEKEKRALTIHNKSRKQELVTISDDDAPFDLPENWAWCRLPQILDVGDSLRRGPFGSSITKSMFVAKSAIATKVYEQKNAIRKDYSLGSYYINLSEYPNLKSFIAGPGDIIISCAGTIGETYLLPSEAPEGIINQALLKLRLYRKTVDDRYFMLVFKASTKSRIEEDAKGTAMKNIGSIDYLKHKLLFPLPPFAEQHRILAKVDELMMLCDELEARITNTSTTRRQLLEATLHEALSS